MQACVKASGCKALACRQNEANQERSSVASLDAGSIGIAYLWSCALRYCDSAVFCDACRESKTMEHSASAQRARSAAQRLDRNLLFQIFDYLRDGRAFLQCEATCTDFHSLLREESGIGQKLWQARPIAYGARVFATGGTAYTCLLYTSPSPRDATLSRMPSSA